MSHARHISSTAQALYRVFVASTVTSAPLRAAPRLRPQVAATTPSFIAIAPQRRTAVKYRPPVQRTVPYDEEIGSRLINLVDDEGFHPGKRLDQVLRSFDRVTHHLVQISASPEDSEHPYPVCKVLSKSFLRDQERTKQKQQAKKSADDLTKTIELNWAVSEHDLGHWLKRLREFLEEGRRVEVVLGPKKRGRKATAEEARAVLDKVKEAAGEVDAKERTAPEGEVGAVMTLFFEGSEKAKEKQREMEKMKASQEGAEGEENKPKVSRWKVKEEERRKKDEEARKKAAQDEERRKQRELQRERNHDWGRRGSNSRPMRYSR